MINGIFTSQTEVTVLARYVRVCCWVPFKITNFPRFHMIGQNTKSHSRVEIGRSVDYIRKHDIRSHLARMFIN